MVLSKVINCVCIQPAICLSYRMLCNLEECAGSITTLGAMHNVYTAYCADNNLVPMPLGSHYSKLIKRLFPTAQNLTCRHQRALQGIKLKKQYGALRDHDYCIQPKLSFPESCVHEFREGHGLFLSVPTNYTINGEVLHYEYMLATDQSIFMKINEICINPLEYGLASKFDFSQQTLNNIIIQNRHIKICFGLKKKEFVSLASRKLLVVNFTLGSVDSDIKFERFVSKRCKVILSPWSNTDNVICESCTSSFKHQLYDKKKREAKEQEGDKKE